MGVVTQGFSVVRDGALQVGHPGQMSQDPQDVALGMHWFPLLERIIGEALQHSITHHRQVELAHGPTSWMNHVTV